MLVSITCVGENNICVGEYDVLVSITCAGEYNICVGEYDMCWSVLHMCW